MIDSYADLTPGATRIVNTGSLAAVGITWPIRAETPLYGGISDRVSTDTNGNGIQDAGEPGLAGVTVNVRRATDNTVAGTATTNASGLWSVSGLAPGDYYVEFVPLSGYGFTQPDQGGNDATDSDANTTTGRTATTTLSSGETDTTWDAGLYQPATLVTRLDRHQR